TSLGALTPMRTWLPFTPNTVTVTSSPTIRVSPTRRVRISIPFSSRITFSGQQSAKENGERPPSEIWCGGPHPSIDQHARKESSGAAIKKTKGAEFSRAFLLERVIHPAWTGH